jgi:hypothetical protein
LSINGFPLALVVVGVVVLVLIGTLIFYRCNLSVQPEVIEKESEVPLSRIFVINVNKMSTGKYKRGDRIDDLVISMIVFVLFLLSFIGVIVAYCFTEYWMYAFILTGLCLVTFVARRIYYQFTESETE